MRILTISALALMLSTGIAVAQPLNSAPSSVAAASDPSSEWQKLMNQPGVRAADGRINTSVLLWAYATKGGVLNLTEGRPGTIWRTASACGEECVKGRSSDDFFNDMAIAEFGGLLVSAEDVTARFVAMANGQLFSLSPAPRGAAQPTMVAQATPAAPAYEAAPEQAGDFIIAADGVTRIPVTRVTAAQAAPAYEAAPVVSYASIAPAIDTAAIAREAARLVPAQAAPEIDAFAIAQQAAGMVEAPGVDTAAIARQAAGMIQVPAAPTVDLQEVARQAAGMIQVPAAPTIDVNAIAADAASRIEIDVDAIASNAANRIKVPSNTELWSALAGLGGLVLLGFGLSALLGRRKAIAKKKSEKEAAEVVTARFESLETRMDGAGIGAVYDDGTPISMGSLTDDLVRHGDLTQQVIDNQDAVLDQGARLGEDVRRTNERVTGLGQAMDGLGENLSGRVAGLEGNMADGHTRLTAAEETIAYQGERLDEIEDHENVIRPIAGETKKPADLKAMSVGDEFVHALLVNGQRTEFRGQITGRADRKNDVFVMIEGVSEKPELSARALSRVKPYIRDHGAPEPTLRLAHG